MQKIAEIYVV